MKNPTYKYSRLAACISLLLGAASASSAFAMAQEEEQSDQASENAEIIQVKGIRGSLSRSQDLKRGSSGVVDAISAEEMGKFPDTNLAESLQRITGVTISRNNGEGSQITVRGFGPEFNMVTLNGRQMPSTGFNRAFNFENLSSEGVNTLEIIKTARADLPSGGIGATVNIVTTKPFSSPGRTLTLMGKAIYDSSNEEGEDVTPEIAGVYSETFADDTFGVALSFSHHRRDFQKQQANIQGWHANVDLPSSPSSVIDSRAVDSEGNPVANFRNSDGESIAAHFFPKDMNYGISNVQRERTNAQLTLQMAPVEDIVMTLDYTMSTSTTGTNDIGWGIWNNFGNNINSYELDQNGTAIFANISGDDGSFTASRNTTEVDSKSIGFNFDWVINESFSLEFDYHDSSSETDNGKDKGLNSAGQVILGSDQLQYKIYDYLTGEIPKFSVLWNNGTNVLGAGEIDSNFSQFLRGPAKTEIQQARIDTEWLPDFDFPLTKVMFGGTFTQQEMNGQNAWSGLRGGPGFGIRYTHIFPDSMFILNDTNDLLDQFSGGGSDLSPNYFYTFSFDEAVARQAAFLTEEAVGSDAYVPDAYYLPATNSKVEEETISLYVSTEWEFEIDEYYLDVNVGLRYEESKVKSPSQSRVPLQVNWVSPSEWTTQFASDGQFVEVINEGEYDLLLPNIDLSLDVTDDIVARLSWGKTISRPGLGLLLGGTSLSGSPKIGARSGARGNTNLVPYQSTNLDLSLEYYYEESSYMALAVFKKDVKDWIDNAIVDITFDGLHDIYRGPRYLEAEQQVIASGEQATDSAIYEQMLANGHGDANNVISPNSSDPLIVWSLSSPENVDERSVKGLEFAIQHVFGESGFGASFNATFVDGDVEYDPYLLANQKVLPGLSDAANLQGFYEKDGLSVKLTYAWRDKYLIGQGQAQGSTFDAPPQFAKAFGQLDLSVNYDVTEDLTVFFEGINLNNETEQGYGRFEKQFLFARQYGTRYVAGARYSF